MSATNQQTVESAPSIQSKTCTGCGETKEFSQFYKKNSTERQSHSYRARCKQCMNLSMSAWEKLNPEKARAKNARYRARNPKKVVAATRRWQDANVDRVRRWRHARQGLPVPTRPEPVVCELCGKPNRAQKYLHLDHCHETGAFRGWLCFSCNTGLGKLGDSIEGLERAIAYLRNINVRN